MLLIDNDLARSREAISWCSRTKSRFFEKLLFLRILARSWKRDLFRVFCVHPFAFLKFVTFLLLASTFALIFMEQHIIKIWFHRILFAWKHTSLPIKFRPSFKIDLGSAESKVWRGCWPISLHILARVISKFTTVTLGCSICCNSSVFAGTMSCTGLEVGGAAKSDVWFIPVKSLIETVHDAVFSFVTRVDRLLNIFPRFLLLLLPLFLQFVFIFLKFQ